MKKSRGLVLADRGFDITVGLMCAQVKIPAFTRECCQLDAKDVEETRKIAHFRVHFEIVIGCVRNKFSILHGTIPLSMFKNDDMTLLDKIVIVCCGLTNMCPSVVLKPSTFITIWKPSDSAFSFATLLALLLYVVTHFSPKERSDKWLCGSYQSLYLCLYLNKKNQYSGCQCHVTQ